MADKRDEQTRLLVHVRYAAAAVDECLHSLHDSVERARRSGASWTRIAKVLGISSQEAAERFGDREESTTR